MRKWGYRRQPVDVDHTAPLIANSRRALGAPAFTAVEAAGRALEFEPAMLELRQWLKRPA